MIIHQNIKIHGKLIAAIGISGSFGAMLRYAVSGWTLNITSSFPLGTMLCNLLGCFVLGLLSFYVTVRNTNSIIRIAISVGLIGSFTTFSTFSVEMMQMIQNKMWVGAFSYMWLSLLGGWFLAWAGFRAAGRVWTYRSSSEESDGK